MGLRIYKTFIKLVKKVWGKILCILDFHDVYSYAEDRGFDFFDLDTQDKNIVELLQDFDEQTILRCRRCKWRMYNKQ